MTAGGGARLDLLRRLTAASPGFVVVKSVDAAVSGSGDIDAAAPAGELAVVAETFRSWAGEHRLTPLAPCRHLPGTLVLAALDEGANRSLVQLDVLERRLLHGLVLVRAADLATGASITDSGLRRASAAAEGTARLVLALRPLARRPSDADELRRLLFEDHDVLDDLATRIEPHLASALRRLARGEWPRRTLLRLELVAAVDAALRPRETWRRVRAAPMLRACPLLRALAAGRRAPADPGWPDAVARAHPTAPL